MLELLHPDALLARGTLLKSEGRTREARDVFETALSTARDSGDASRALTAASLITQITMQEGDTAGAIETLREMLGEATGPESRRARILALLGIANAMVRHGVHPDALTSAGEALTLARELGHFRFQGVALRLMSAAHTLAGDAKAAFDAANGAVEAAEKIGDPLLLAQTRHRLAEALIEVGETARAVLEFERCIAFCREHGENPVLCISLAGLGAALLSQGDTGAAARHATDALAVARRLGDRHLQTAIQELLAQIAERAGDLAGSLAAQRERFRVDGEIRSAQSAVRLDRMRAELESERRQAAEMRAAEAALSEALAQVETFRARLDAENQYLREEIVASGGFQDIVGRSANLRRVLHQVAQVAPTEASVLILGETGVGKELIARAIHARSPRHDRALVTVNCAALPATLIESELFGHEKGAFTGALHRKIGRFELADGGTIFLDEIGELPLELQAKLLRVLQDGEFERLGESVTRRADVRVVAASNRDLVAESRDGKFRADLYYRLAVFAIDVPPLRDRRDDIPLLVAHFASRFQTRMGKRIERIPEETMRRFTSYDWPGNVRELANVVHRAVILSPGEVLLPDGVFGLPTPAAAESAPVPPPAAAVIDDSMEAAERAHVLRVLEACDWKIKGAGNAAARLGMAPSTLRFRMSRLGIQREAAR